MSDRDQGAGATLTDWELWACATVIEKQYGDRAPLYVAERLGELALAGDAGNIAIWQAIARRLDQLARPPAAI